MKRVLITTGGGDCPGLNAVIRAIVKRASQETDWEVLGSIQAFNGVLWEPQEIVRLTPEVVRGIHFRGGTIIETTNTEYISVAAQLSRQPTKAARSAGQSRKTTALGKWSTAAMR